MAIKLTDYTEGDRYLIAYIAKEIAKVERISIVEALKYVDDSYFLTMLRLHPRFIHHEDPHSIVKDLIYVYHRDRKGVLHTQ